MPDLNVKKYLEIKQIHYYYFFIHNIIITNTILGIGLVISIIAAIANDQVN